MDIHRTFYSYPRKSAILKNGRNEAFRFTVAKDPLPICCSPEPVEELFLAQVRYVVVQETVVEKAEFSEEIRGLMEQLPDAYRNVLTLVDIYQFDYSEAAQTLRVPIGTVKSRLARARLQMRDMLKGVLDDTSLLKTTNLLCS